jgi:hypothetical protein
MLQTAMVMDAHGMLNILVHAVILTLQHSMQTLCVVLVSTEQQF